MNKGVNDWGQARSVSPYLLGAASLSGWLLAVACSDAPLISIQRGGGGGGGSGDTSGAATIGGKTITETGGTSEVVVAGKSAGGRSSTGGAPSTGGHYPFEAGAGGAPVAGGQGGEPSAAIGGEGGASGAGGATDEPPVLGSELIAWNDKTMVVERSLGNKLAPPEYWTQDALFYGSAANLIGDVTGDGRADLVAWNDHDAMYVLFSTGHDFISTGSTWTTGIIAPGKRATALGDVNNDKKLDLIAWNDDNVKVNLSTGTSFGATKDFLTGFPFYGNVANLVGDVTGDGRADLVAWPNNDAMYVLKSNGSAFVSPTGTTWTQGIVAAGTRASLLGDVDGDKRADLIAWNDDNVKVNLSTGTTFATTATWSAGHTFYGSKANLVTDINGDGRADLVAWNADNIQVELSTGAAFSPPATWISNTPFQGTRANVAGQIE